MRIFTEKYRLLAALGTVLVTGFLLIGISSYISARDSIRSQVTNQVLPLVGDNIQAEIRTALSQPILFSASIAQDALLRDWITNAEGNTEPLVRYLNQINQRPGAYPAFAISDRTRQSYHADGVVKPIQEADARSKWLSRLRELKTPHQIRIEGDGAIAYVHHSVLDQAGGFVGATGVTVALDRLAMLIDQQQARTHTSAYLIDGSGIVVLSGKTARPPRSIHDRAGIRTIASALVNPGGGQGALEYQLNGSPTLVHTRSLPELGLQLVVERDLSADLAALQPMLWRNFAIGAGATLLALALMLWTSNRYQQRLERMASTDPLTGLINRQAFEIVLRQSMRDFDRNGRPLSVILFDIDLFKHINDSHGHQGGDYVLLAVAELTRGVVRENDIVTRWGGEEFLILLRDCELAVAARLADKLRGAIAAHDFALPDDAPITASVGVAQYALQEMETHFFDRAEQARREAKSSGRNRTVISLIEGQDPHGPAIPEPVAVAT